MRSPQQDLFSELLIRLRKEFGTGRVYDGFLPQEGTPYPFIYLGDNHQIDDFGNKMQILGEVRQTIDVYMDNPKKRGTLSDYLDRIVETARGIGQTSSYRWRISSVDQQIFPDTTTATPLVHGVIDITFRLLGGN